MLSLPFWLGFGDQGRAFTGEKFSTKAELNKRRQEAMSKVKGGDAAKQMRRDMIRRGGARRQ